MISNIIPCCRKCFNSNNSFYVKVKNITSYYLYIVIEYRVGTKVVRKQSPVFKPGKSEYLTFSSDTPSVLFRVFDASQMPPRILCIRTPRVDMSSCYNVILEETGEILCLEVPC